MVQVFFSIIFESLPEISNNVVSANSKASDAHKRSLIRAFASRLTILTEHHSEFLSLKAAQARLSLFCQYATLLEITCRIIY